ncbi:MAG: C25 family cysteine peptidase, partial [Pseudomonadota bacterium]
WFDGTDVATTTVSVPDGVLVAGTNTLELTAPGDTGNPFDIMAYEGLAAAFTRAPQAVGGAWKGMIDQGGKFAITGFAGDVVAWRGDRRRTGTDTINLRGQGHWIAVEVGETLAPSIQADVPPASGRPPRGQVDYLIIAHDQFVATAALDDLQSLQQARGYSTRVVAAEEIYAHYSDYERSAAAIGEFIRHARPRFVLLVGGDSTDYHDHLGLASQSFVPTHYVQTDDLVTYAPADGPYVDFNGNGTPQAAIGRLPVRTEDELDLLVAKLQTYLPPDTAHFSAGPSDSGRQFAELSEGYAASLSSAWAFEETYADDFAVLADANAALTDALNGTGMLVSYLGHSSFGIWGLNPSHGILFRANEARALANAAPHLITQWGCWNTYFVDPQLDTMANGFLLQDDGAAHVLGAAALTDVNLLRQFGERFFDEIGRQDTVGETLRFAIQRYIQADPNAARALRGFAFLGDPAAPLY